MAFKVKNSIMLKNAADQVEALITMTSQRYVVWTDESLFEFLNDRGLDFTLEEVRKLNDEMHTRGVVEDVPEE